MSGPKRNPNIRYINPSIPPFDLPAISGKSYRVIEPDTLDLAERASLAVHGSTVSTDPEYNAEQYSYVWFGTKPPIMIHDTNDWCEYKWYAPSMLLRLACGSEDWMDVEWHRMANLLQMQAPDGLLYIPTVGRPWAKDFGFGAPMLETEVGDHLICLSLLARQIESAAVYHVMTGDRQWRELARGIVRRLGQLVTDRGDYAYFDKAVYAPGDVRVEGPTPPPNINCVAAWLGQGLVTAYRMIGDGAALELGYKLANLFAQGHSGFVGPNGEFRLTHGHKSFEDTTGDIHFHMNTQVRMLLLDAGIAAGDARMVELAQRGYAFGRDHSRSDALMGYFPMHLGVEEGANTEICEVADMIYLALRQSTAGIADCWDDVDSWVRNMLSEAQLLETDWVHEYSEEHGTPMDHPYGFECIPEKWKGSWGGWILPNEWQGDPRHSIQPCCPGNAAMQLYRVWRDMMDYDKDVNRLNVHLLMNRVSPWADVSSHIPYEGLVEVRLKRDCQVALRIPEWAEPQACEVLVNNVAGDVLREGRYLAVRAKLGDTVTLRCPLIERTERLRIIDEDYTAVVRGNEIVDIDPPGQHYPIFRKPHYRTGETRWRTVDRFVADRVIGTY